MITNFNIDLILISVFLVLNLGLGLWYGKGVKTMKDFALGGRNFSTGALTATLVATWIGGGTLSFGLRELYTVGILALCVSGQIFNLLLTAYVLVPRMQEFLGKLSIAEIVGSIYTPAIRNIVSCASIVKSITGIAIQIKVLSAIFYYFSGVSSSYTTIISSMIVTIYSAFGGVRAVILTDIFQFLTFGAFIPTLALLIWNSFGSLDAILTTLTTNPIFDPKLLVDFSNPTVLKYYGVFFYCLIPDIDPPMFHRVLIARSTRQATQAFNNAAIICLLFWSFTFFIALVLLSSNPDIEPNSLLPYIIDSYSYPGFKAMIIIGIIAIAMSTADSCTNSAAVIFVNNLCGPLRLFANNQKLQLKAARAFSIIIGIVGLFMALSHKSILDILLFGASFYTSIVGIPLLFTILGFRSTPRVILSSMAAGALTTYIWNKYFNAAFPIGDIVPSTLANLIVMMVMHYALREPGGWVGPKDRSPLDVIQAQRKQRNDAILNFYRSLPNLFTWKNVLAYCNDDTYRGKRYYVTYVAFTTASLLLMASVGNNSYIDKQHASMINAAIIIFGLGVNALLLYIKAVPVRTGDILEEFSNKYLGFIWHIAVFCSLVWSNTMLALVGGFNTMLTICFMANLVIVGLLLRWHTALFMILTGVPLATAVFTLIVQYNSFIIDTELLMSNLKWNIIGSLALISAVTAIIKLRQDQFVEKSQSLVKLENKVLGMELTLDTKDQKMEKLLNSKQYIFNNLSNEIKSPMSVVQTTISLLSKLLPEYYQTNLVFKKKKEVLNMLNLAHSSIKQLVSYSNNLFDLSQFEKRQMVFNIELNNLELLIKGVIDECNKTYGNSTRIITLDYHSGAETIFELDYLRIRQALLNLIGNAIQYSPSGVIEVKVMPYRQGAQIVIEDQGLGIPDAELETIFEPFEESSYTKSQANGRGLGLTVAREIILHHHGTITASNRTDRQGSKFTLQLPIRQPQGSFNQGMHSKNKIFGNRQTYEQRIKAITEKTPAFQQNINTVQSLKDIEDQIRTNKSIMIIDDDQSFLDSVSLNIYAEYYKATPVINPFEAIKLVRETPEFYSMILLDINMPGKTGDKVLRAISDVTGMYSIPVIVVSGFELPHNTRILLYSLGTSVIIPKPCNHDDIRDLINRYLRPSATAVFTPSNSNKYSTT